jgi:hypothetical protein
VIILVALTLLQSHFPAGGPKIVFEKASYDFGTIARQADGTCYFSFTNKGDAPLVITKVTAACGCTVPSYPKEPILPGETGQIKVQYNTKKTGVFTKTITVSTNDTSNPSVVLTIKGNVTR